VTWDGAKCARLCDRQPAAADDDYVTKEVRTADFLEAMGFAQLALTARTKCEWSGLLTKGASD
jgi:hypothetical protein